MKNIKSSKRRPWFNNNISSLWIHSRKYKTDNLYRIGLEKYNFVHLRLHFCEFFCGNDIATAKSLISLYRWFLSINILSIAFKFSFKQNCSLWKWNCYWRKSCVFVSIAFENNQFPHNKNIETYNWNSAMSDDTQQHRNNSVD